jgi:hypothetical protein
MSSDLILSARQQKEKPSIQELRQRRELSKEIFAYYQIQTISFSGFHLLSMGYIGRIDQ